MTDDRAGLYVHIPFCLSKCGYCSFYSVSATDLLDQFVPAVILEMEFYKSTFPSFDTIYIGGGTPSLLSAKQINDLLTAARRHFRFDEPENNHPPRHAGGYPEGHEYPGGHECRYPEYIEITMEVNPGDASLEYLQTLHNLGINRLNIGIQSFDDELLKFLGRRHTAKQAAAVINDARLAGFHNIGIDLIYGVHAQEINDWKQTLHKALSFSPEHLSCYQLSLEEKTPLYAKYQQNGLKMPAEKEALDFFVTTSQLLTDAGYRHYEVSNFARVDYLKSSHNTKYWRHNPYLGLGPAAHSFLDTNRWWNKASITAYLQNIAAGRKPLEKSESLSLEQLALESWFLGMRTKDGINLKQYKNRFGADLLMEKRQSIDQLIQNNLLELKNGCLSPTLAGMAVADSLALI